MAENGTIFLCLCCGRITLRVVFHHYLMVINLYSTQICQSIMISYLTHFYLVQQLVYKV